MLMIVHIHCLRAQLLEMDLAIARSALIAAFEKKIMIFQSMFVVVVSICTRESQCLLSDCPMT